MEYIIVFPDTNSAITAESRLPVAGVAVSVMPLPESIGTGCGITLRLDERSLSKALRILHECNVDVGAVYLREKAPMGYKYTLHDGHIAG